MEFSLEVDDIIQELFFLGVVVSAVKTNETPGVDAMKLVVDAAFDIAFAPLSLFAVFLLYGFDLSFFYFFSCLSTDSPLGFQHISSIAWLAAITPRSSKRAMQTRLFMRVAGFKGSNVLTY